MHAPDTIIAVASPPGRSLRGIVRISGPHAFAVADVSAAQHRRGIAYASIAFDGHRLSVLRCVFPSPHSYTGEDSVELQMPGNPALLDRVVNTLLAAGRVRNMDIRRAEPGEFTARAFFNGRLDLTQAEGVAATIAAQSDAEHAAARMLVSGRLGDFARQAADELAGSLALVEAGIDFTDQDDVVAIAPVELHGRLTAMHERIESHVRHATGMEHLRAIPWVAIVGRPNAGKSTLFNALLGHERAVVSPVAGTTRDVLAEPMTIDVGHGRAEVMLVDLAGLDDADESAMNALMQAAARAAIDRAELLVRCVPIGEDIPDARPNQIVVRTKSDIASSIAAGEKALAVSAITGEGLDRLRSAIADRLAARAVSCAADALALQPRHEAALRSTCTNLAEAIALLEPHRGSRTLEHPELIASAMRAALDDLAALAGDMTPDDILGRVFATFCIGK